MMEYFPIISADQKLKKKWMTLDRFISPLKKFFVEQPKENQQMLFGIFDNKQVYAYAIDGELYFTLQSLADYVGMKYNSVAWVFNKYIKKGIFDSSEPYLILNTDYLKMERTSLYSIEQNSIGSKGDKFVYFIHFKGVWKLLPRFRSQVALEFYLWFGEELYSKARKLRQIENTQDITESTKKRIRDLIEMIRLVYGFRPWRELRQKFEFSKLDGISDKTGMEIIAYLKRKYMEE